MVCMYFGVTLAHILSYFHDIVLKKRINHDHFTKFHSSPFSCFGDNESYIYIVVVIMKFVNILTGEKEKKGRKRVQVSVLHLKIA